MTVEQQIREALSLYFHDGDVVELRCLELQQGNRKATASGYYDDMDKLAHDAAAVDGLCAGIYVVMNRINPALLARRANKLEVSAFKKLESTTADDVTRRTHLLIDVDAKRPSGISSTQEELDFAVTKARDIRAWLRDMGWPGGVLVMSGNGAQLVYDVDLPNDPESGELVKACLKSLDMVKSDDHAHVDVSVVDPSRIWKLPGTMACKGSNTVERPHRRSCVLEAEQDRAVVRVDQLRELAHLSEVMEPKQQPKLKTDYTGPAIDATDLVSRMGLRVISTRRTSGGEIHKLNHCPWNSNHDGAFVVQYDNGWVRVGCPHNSCGGAQNDRTKELLDQYLPEWRADKKDVKPAPIAETTVATPAGSYTLDDQGNARRFVDKFRDMLRYCPEQKAWYIWDDRRWLVQATGDNSVANRLADQVAADLRIEAAAEPDESRRKTLFAHAGRSGSGRARSAIVTIAKDYLVAHPWDFDQDDMLYNAWNVTIDLRTGKAKAHDRMDMITCISPVVYDEKARAELFLQVLRRATNNDKALMDYFLEVLGYSLTGINTQKAFYVLVGPKDTAKSLVMNAFLYLMGDYAHTTHTETFLVSGRADPQGKAFDMSRWTRARVVVTAENADGKRFNDSLIKPWTGRDRMTAEAKHCPAFEFDPKAKLFFYSNNVPRVDGGDGAMLKRLKILPFKVQIPEDEQDLSLSEKLVAEASLSGIFNLLLEGCLRWQKRTGYIPVPGVVVQAIDEFRRENDALTAYTIDRLELVGDQTVMASISDVHEDYKKWCERTGEPNVYGSRIFNKKLGERLNRKPEQSTGGYYWWKGVRLRDEKPAMSQAERRKLIIASVRELMKSYPEGVWLDNVYREMALKRVDRATVEKEVEDMKVIGELWSPKPDVVLVPG